MNTAKMFVLMGLIFATIGSGVFAQGNGVGRGVPRSGVPVPPVVRNARAVEARQAALDRARQLTRRQAEDRAREIRRDLIERPDRPTRPESPQADADTPRGPNRTFAPTRPLTAREEALRRRLSAIDAIRDEAIATGNVELLEQADTLEQQAHGPREFERGLGRETARQVRGVEELPGHDWSEFGPGAPGFGRRTAQERRELRLGTPDLNPAEGPVVTDVQPEALPPVLENEPALPSSEGIFE